MHRSTISLAVAIRDIRSQVFTSRSGDRKWASDLLIFITDYSSTLEQYDVIEQV